jgi:hypothetical protein
MPGGAPNGRWSQILSQEKLNEPTRMSEPQNPNKKPKTIP